ncbi:hypothetical protein GN244_ATG12845 [Phytophthora infestans]|uniref:Uncharacterized protein n=1 Tax=Phytophthora infestans TaxID=4787 RepID=A0A833WS29_PHYIN|nr:hypothetical protein GN244_ATG12845 [Phytophthora infestans]
MRTSSTASNDNARNGNDDERGFTASTALEKVESLLGPTKLSPSEQQILQIRGWLDKGGSLDETFEKLRLHKIPGTVFGNPHFDDLAKAMDDFNAQNPTKLKSLIPTLTRNYLGPKDLSKILEDAKTVPATEGPSKFRRGCIAREDTVLSSPKFSDWLKYFNTFNHENSSKKEKLLDPFQRYFRARGVTKIADDAVNNPSTREIGRQLKVEQLDRWLGLEYDPEDVFHSLFLNKPGMPSSDRMAPDGTFYTVRLNTVPDNLLPAWILNFGLSIYETLTRSTPTGKRQ